jgi:hypothetical protein
MKPAFAMALMLSLAAAQTVHAAQPRPVLIEMFVSQSCSSCPPANALLQALAAQDKYILPLSLNVTYWNNLGWHDKDSMDATTARQYWYAGLSTGNVYTPEAVVDGTAQLVGSDKAKLTAAIAAARAAPAGNEAMHIASGGAMVTLEIPQGDGAAGQLILYGYDARHVTPVAAGENAGTVITEINVVRSVTMLGPWNGLDEKFTLPHPAGEHLALLLQAKDGAVLGLASQ